MAEKRFILAKDDEQAKALLKGGTATDNNGKEITAGENSVVFVPEEKEFFTYFYVAFPENSTTLTIDLSPIQEDVTIDWGDGTINKEKTHTYVDGNKIPKVIAVKNLTELPYALFDKSRYEESSNSLVGVKIGESVKRVSPSFTACNNLSFVELPTISNATNYMYFALAFTNCEKLTKVVVPTPYFEFVEAFGAAKEIEFLSPIPPKQLHIGGAGATPITKYIVPRSAVELYKTEFAKISTEHANNVETYAYESEIPEPLYKYTLECYVPSPDIKGMENDAFDTILGSGLTFTIDYRHFTFDFYSRVNWEGIELNTRTKMAAAHQITSLSKKLVTMIGSGFTATASGRWYEDFKFETLSEYEQESILAILRSIDSSLNTENLVWGKVFLSANAVYITPTTIYGEEHQTFQIAMDMRFEGNVPLFNKNIGIISVETKSKIYTMADFSEVYITKNLVR